MKKIQTKEELEKNEEHLKERSRRDFEKILNMSEGRRVIWDLLENAGVWRNSFVAGDPNVTAFNEGKRDIGLMILQKIQNIKPQALLQMSNEHKSDHFQIQRSKPVQYHIGF